MMTRWWWWCFEVVVVVERVFDIRGDDRLRNDARVLVVWCWESRLLHLYLLRGECMDPAWRDCVREV